MSIQDSIKAKLKNRAIEDNRTFQEILTIYGLERMLYRLSISKYASTYILKGGILLYAMYQGKYSRGTADVDLLGKSVSNDLETVKDSFREIFNISCDEDGLVFDSYSLRATRITEFKKYPGINISIDGYLAKTKISVQIDIGFGDVIHPEIEDIVYPTLIDMAAPIIQAYSKESIIAEKFQAIVSLGYTNSRMKDFYDIYALLITYDFEFESLRDAIDKTFKNRNTEVDNIVAFEVDFAMDPNRKKLWAGFVKTKKVDPQIELSTVIDLISAFLKPVLDLTIQNLDLTWNHIHLLWKQSH